jgi:hypothetical protein
MPTETELPIIDHLPELGEKVIIVDMNGGEHLATIVKRVRVMFLSPKLFGLTPSYYTEERLKELDNGYQNEIRYFEYDNGPVNGYPGSFCIMRFNKMGGGYEFNKNVRKVS